MKKIKVIFNTSKKIHLSPTVLSQAFLNKFKNKFVLTSNAKEYLQMVYRQVFKSLKIKSSISWHIIKQYTIIKDKLCSISNLGTIFIKQYSSLFINLSLKQQVLHPYLAIHGLITKYMKLQSLIGKHIINQYAIIQNRITLSHSIKNLFIKQYTYLSNNLSLKNHVSQSCLLTYTTLLQKIGLKNFVNKGFINQFTLLFSKVRTSVTLQTPKINQTSTIHSTISFKQSIFRFRVGQLNVIQSSITAGSKIYFAATQIFRRTAFGLKVSLTLSGRYDFYNSLNRKIGLMSHVAKGRIVRQRRLNEWTGTFATWNGKTLEDIYYI